MRILYSLVLYLSDFILSVISIVGKNQKIKSLKVGRKNTFARLKQLPVKETKRVWAHAASLGEFEMLRPLLESLEKKVSLEIHISFFSPSGYEHAKIPENWTKWYLLSDTTANANYWINQLQPDFVVWAKYEFWLNHLSALNRSNIPFVYWNLLLREKHFLGKLVFNSWRKEISKAQKLYCQDVQTSQLSSQWFKATNEIGGDFRFLRAKIETEKASSTNLDWNGVVKSKNILIVGSAWEPELKAIQYYLNNHTLPTENIIIIAPHDVSESRISDIENQFIDYKTVRLSRLTEDEKPEIILVDSIGLLSRIYAMGNISIVGGGFVNALHNIVEPLSYGLPVLTGSNTHKFPEAALAEKYHALLRCDTSEVLASKLHDIWSDPEKLTELQHAAKDHFLSRVPDIEKATGDCLQFVTN